MIRPNRENMSSTSFWVMVLGSPLMYRLASLMTSELGRAYDTLKTKPLSEVRAGVWPKHGGRVFNLGVSKSQPLAEDHTNTHPLWQHMLAAPHGSGSEPTPGSIFSPGPHIPVRATLFLFYKVSDRGPKAGWWQGRDPSLLPILCPWPYAPLMHWAENRTWPCLRSLRDSGQAGCCWEFGIRLPTDKLTTGVPSSTLNCSVLNDSRSFGLMFCTQRKPERLLLCLR